MEAGHGAVAVRRDAKRFASELYLLAGDLYCPSTIATTYGHPAQPWHAHATASGVDVFRNGGIAAACLVSSAARAGKGCPIPGLPWGTVVEVFCGKAVRTFPILHDEPQDNESGESYIALTPMAWELLFRPAAKTYPGGNYAAVVAFRVLGVARFFCDHGHEATAVTPATGVLGS